MHPKFQRAEKNFIDGMAMVSSILNFSEAMGRIYGALFFSSSPLSLDDLCEKLSLTKGTVSVYLRELEDRKIVKRSWATGRKKYYEAEYSPQKLIEHRVEHIGERNIHGLLKIIEECQVMLKKFQIPAEGEDKISAQLYYERLEKIKTLNLALEKFLTFISRSDSAQELKEIKKIKIT